MSKKIYILALFVGLTTTLFPPPLSADDSGIISLFGMSFACEECEVRTDPPCRVTFRALAQVLSCEEATTRLLKEVIDKGKEPKHPTAAELRHFLLSGVQPAEAAAMAVKLLLMSDA